MNEKLKSARTASSMTQAQVAKESGVSVRVYQTYEYGKSVPSVTVALKIAEVLKKKVEELF